MRQFHLYLLIFAALLPIKDGVAQESGRKEVGTSTCQKDLSVLSTPEIRALTREERNAFVRSREEDSKRLANDITNLLTDEVSEKLFQLEQSLGLSPTEKISRAMTIEEITKRLVAISASKHLVQNK